MTSWWSTATATSRCCTPGLPTRDPQFPTPTRNQIGIIGPIPRREFDPASIRAKIEASPFVRDKTATPRLLTLTQSTYYGKGSDVEEIKASLDGYVDALHFDEAWLPHAAFHDFYHQMHAIGPGRPRCATSLVVATQFHPQAAGRPVAGITDPGAGF